MACTFIFPVSMKREQIKNISGRIKKNTVYHVERIFIQNIKIRLNFGIFGIINIYTSRCYLHT